MVSGLSGPATRHVDLERRYGCLGAGDLRLFGWRAWWCDIRFHPAKGVVADGCAQDADRCGNAAIDQHGDLQLRRCAVACRDDHSACVLRQGYWRAWVGGHLGYLPEGNCGPERRVVQYVRQYFLDYDTDYYRLHHSGHRLVQWRAGLCRSQCPRCGVQLSGRRGGNQATAVEKLVCVESQVGRPTIRRRSTRVTEVSRRRAKTVRTRMPANTALTSNVDSACSIRYPIPRDEPRYSPITAPTKAMPTDMCRLENTQLIAEGI